MVLSHSTAPCHRDQFEHVAKFIPPIPKEPAVAEANPIRRAFEARGFYGPFHVRLGDGVIRDRSGEPMFMALQVLDRDLQHAMAADSCRALNLACGFKAAATEHGPMADAAE